MSQSWLKDLEEKVHAASKALRELREENAELKARVEELEAQLADAGAEGDSEADRKEAEAWKEERDEIRGRVETLADQLAELLGDE